MQGPVVLPDDVQIVPLTELPPSIRTQLEGQDSDFALTRPLSRTPSKVIDSSAAALLRQFRGPKTIVDAILAYSKEVKAQPAAVLEEAYPLIESCLLARLLVKPGSESEKIQPCFAPRDRIAEYVVERSIQALIDSEVYQVRMPGGRLAALKIARPNASPLMRKSLAREADLLRLIGGAPAPELLEISQLADGRPYLLVEWFEGDDAQSAVQKINQGAGPDAATRIAALCANIVDAYALLHEHGVLHSDVHPRNVLVSETGEVRIIDFGIGREVDSDHSTNPRAGVAFFFEPEYARALRKGARNLAPSLAGEQYAVAALLYSLLCGKHYVDFSFDRDELLRQIAEEPPLSFERRGASQYRALEPVILRALDKESSRRFESTRQFARTLHGASLAGQRRQPRQPHDASEEKKLLERVVAIIAEPRHALDYTGPKSPSASLTYGAAGIGYAAYRLACAREDPRLLAWADAWAERSLGEEGEAAFYSSAIQITPATVGRVSPYHTASGLAAVQALMANARSDKFHLDAAINRYLDFTSEECGNPDLTLGKASVLHGLTLLLEACGPQQPPAILDRGNSLCIGLQALIETEPAIGNGGTVSYLGIAHGWAGLLYAILRWCRLTGTTPPAAVRIRLGELAGRAQFTRRGARWPVQAVAGSISMAGWCNGSAGYAHLWTLAHRDLGDPLYLELAEKSAMDAFEGTGGGHALCCGFAGQAYAQLSLYKHTHDRHWLDQARTLTSRAAAMGNITLSVGEEGLPYSLYKGDVGVAVLVAEMEKPERATMPFFEPEP